MDIILKDTESIMSCSSAGFVNTVKKPEWIFWISEFSMADLDWYEKYQISKMLNQKQLFKYSFNSYEIETIFNLFNQYSANISVSDASALVIAQNLENGLIINRNGIYRKICNTLNIRNEDFNWFFKNII